MHYNIRGRKLNDTAAIGSKGSLDLCVCSKEEATDRPIFGSSRTILYVLSVGFFHEKLLKIHFIVK
jgi:hypothetical protein